MPPVQDSPQSLSILLLLSAFIGGSTAEDAEERGVDMGWIADRRIGPHCHCDILFAFHRIRLSWHSTVKHGCASRLQADRHP
jgi:hypothetical protein